MNFQRKNNGLKTFKTFSSSRYQKEKDEIEENCAIKINEIKQKMQEDAEDQTKLLLLQAKEDNKNLQDEMNARVSAIRIHSLKRNIFINSSRC